LFTGKFHGLAVSKKKIDDLLRCILTTAVWDLTSMKNWVYFLQGWIQQITPHSNLFQFFRF